MVEMTLGRFGDRRLEKGGPSCTPVLSRRVGVGCGFADWAAAARGRSG